MTILPWNVGQIYRDEDGEIIALVIPRERSIAEYVRDYCREQYGAEPLALSINSVESDGDEMSVTVAVRLSPFAQRVDVKIVPVSLDP